MNAFSIELSRNISKSLEGFENRNGYVFGANNHHLLNEEEKYHSRVFRIQSSLVQTCEQLGHIKIYLNRYPFKKYYLQKNISQLEYIQYHTEVLFHKIHTISEIMKLLLNEVYQFGISEKDCSWFKIVEKLPKSAEPMLCLDTYFKTFSNLIDLRHRNTHRGYYEDKEKDDIDLKYGYAFYKFENSGFEMDEELKQRLPLPLINRLIREHRKKRVKLVEICIDENEKCLKHFLASLYKEYQNQIKNGLQVQNKL